MALNSLIEKLFGKNDKTPKPIARDRLQFILNRADIPAPLREEIRREILIVLRRHLIIDEQVKP